MSEHDDLTERLRALGTNPVPPPVASEHLTAMAELTRPRSTLAHKLRVGAAFGAGLLIGGTGLAAAGALPDQAQDAAHEVLATVGVDVPPGHAKSEEAKAAARERGANAGGNVARNSEDCPEGEEFRNHGEYVRSVAKTLRTIEDEAEREAAMRAAAESDCGKPDHAADGEEVEGEELPDEATTGQEKAAEKRKAAEERKAAGQANAPDGAGTQGDEAVDEHRPATPPTPPADGNDGEGEGEDVRPDDVPPVDTPGGAPSQTPGNGGSTED